MKFANDVLPLGNKYVGIVVAFLGEAEMAEEVFFFFFSFDC